MLALPIDKKDISQGWQEFQTRESDTNGAVDEENEEKGKKAAKKSLKIDCPAAAKMKDGTVFAFRFRTGDDDEDEEPEWDVVLPNYDEEEDAEMA